jgi:hypothetical protein
MFHTMQMDHNAVYTQNRANRHSAVNGHNAQIDNTKVITHKWV